MKFYIRLLALTLAMIMAVAALASCDGGSAAGGTETTDAVTDAQELLNRYRVQLDYYARALEQLTGKKVVEKIIYSFALQREIRYDMS